MQDAVFKNMIARAIKADEKNTLDSTGLGLDFRNFRPAAE
jgi:hypothetical protein